VVSVTHGKRSQQRRRPLEARELEPRLEELVMGQTWVKLIAGPMPQDATMPRLMSGPHPRAVGSYADAWLTFCLDRLDWRPHWFQRLVAARLLEHDLTGELVWSKALVSTTRQVGKSAVLRSLAMFRVACPEVWARGGEPIPQVAFLASTTLKLASETMRPAMLWADRRPGWQSYRGAADPHIECLDNGGRWLLGAANATHGFSVNLPITDEAWGLAASAVEDHMEPTMLEAQMPQFLVTSTAHQDATMYVPQIRAQAADELAEPDDLLILEWSAPPGVTDVLDERAWRLASPRWSDQRERLLRSKVKSPQVDAVSFRTQYLNIWPDKSELTMRHQLADPGLYARSQGQGATGLGELVVVAVEDWWGTEGAVAVAEVREGRVHLSGQLFPTRSAAWDYVDGLTRALDADVRLVVGATLGTDPRLEAMAVAAELRGTRETRTALGLYRSLLRDGVLVHDVAAPDLTRQMLAARLASTSTAGIRFDETERHDLASAAIWAIQEAATGFGLVG
jgi:hypothetical protein